MSHMNNILIIGGAGYVGSAACAYLLDRGHDVTVLDDLSTGHAEFLLTDHFVHARAGDRKALSALLEKKRLDCVMHFAASASVAESFHKKSEYFENNLEQTQRLLDTLLDHGIKRFVFSSTCAVYGMPSQTGPIDETWGKFPINPYGASKLAAEEAITDLAKTRGLRAISLRYFNASGADPDLRVGEWHEPETHLIPLVLRAAMHGLPLHINGTDYPTADGTCVRDYVHVFDLAWAHETAMFRLLNSMDKLTPDSSAESQIFAKGSHEQFNIGTGRGFSIRQIIAAAEKITGRSVKIIESPRRSGDAASLVASIARAQTTLGFTARFSNLESILSTAYHWELKLSSMRSHLKEKPA